jgi:hypothetical protein
MADAALTTKTYTTKGSMSVLFKGGKEVNNFILKKIM